jgi:hypothetical protein
LLLVASAALSRAAFAGPTLSDAQQVVAALQFAPGDLHVIGGVAAGRGGNRAHRAGEPLALEAEVSRPAYVAVLQVLRTGDTTEIFPNRTHPDAHLAANAPLRITLAAAPAKPGASDRGAGVVLYEFIAVAKGTSWLFHPRPASGSEFAVLGPTTRALARDIEMSLRSGPGSAATAFVTVQIEP